MVRRWSIPRGLNLLAALVVGCAGLAFFAAGASGGEAGRQDETAADSSAEETSPAADSLEEKTAPPEEAASEPGKPTGAERAPEEPAAPGEAEAPTPEAGQAKTPEPEAPRPGVSVARRHRRRRRAPRGTTLPGALGVRLGYIVPGQGQADFSGGLICGLYYRAGRKEQKTEYEVGIDFSTSRSVDAVSAAGQVWARAAALYRPVDDRSFYVLGGVEVIGELYEDGSHYVNGAAVLAAVDLGLGLTVIERKLDVRVTYSLFLGSKNVPGAACAMVGYCF